MQVGKKTKNKKINCYHEILERVDKSNIYQQWRGRDSDADVPNAAVKKFQLTDDTHCSYSNMQSAFISYRS